MICNYDTRIVGDKKAWRGRAWGQLLLCCCARTFKECILVSWSVLFCFTDCVTVKTCCWLNRVLPISCWLTFGYNIPRPSFAKCRGVCIRICSAESLRFALPENLTTLHAWFYWLIHCHTRKIRKREEMEARQKHNQDLLADERYILERCWENR